MLRPNFQTDVLSLSDFRANASTLLEQMRENRRPLVITQNGKSTAIILTPADYDELMERIDILNDVRVAEADIAQGHTLPQNRAKQHILQELRTKHRKEEE
jgi:antitoxin YefM